MGDGDHIYISKLREDLASARIDRREFLRLSTLLGLSATAAFGFADKVCGSASAATTKADLPLGGMVRIQTRLQEIDDVHAISWGEASQVPRQVVEHLARTHQDNITRPHLLDAWEVSEDLRTWTLRLRRDVRWRRGRLFHADDVVWNITRILDPATGSSVVGLMQSYMLQEVDTGKLDKDGKKILEHRLWDANAVEKVDDFTVRLNLREPQIAVPEHLYHFPFVMLDPEEGGKFGPSSNGTGPFTLVDYAIGEEAVLEAVSGYWGEGPYLDTLEFVDLGEDESAWIAALWSGQVHGLREVSATKRAWLKDTPDIVL